MTDHYRCILKVNLFIIDTDVQNAKLPTSFTNSPGAYEDIFTPFGTKALTQNLKSLSTENQFFLCQLGHLWVLSHTVGTDFGS